MCADEISTNYSQNYIQTDLDRFKIIEALEQITATLTEMNKINAIVLEKLEKYEKL